MCRALEVLYMALDRRVVEFEVSLVFELDPFDLDMISWIRVAWI